MEKNVIHISLFSICFILHCLFLSVSDMPLPSTPASHQVLNMHANATHAYSRFSLPVWTKPRSWMRYAAVTSRKDGIQSWSCKGVHRLCLGAQGGSRVAASLLHPTCNTSLVSTYTVIALPQVVGCSVCNKQSDEKVMHLQSLRN